MWGSRRQRRPASTALIICALLVGGCATWRVPQIDPSGEALFVLPDPAPVAVVAAPAAAPPATAPAPVPAVGVSLPATPYRDSPGAPRAWDGMQLTLHPQVTVAPVGSEVVLVAGVVGPDQYLRTNQRIEWILDPGGVGSFVDLNRRTWSDWLVLDGNWPQKLTNTYAIGSTSRQYWRLTRGTPQPADDVLVLRGQAWISVSSAVEGTSYVTATSPCVYGWECRKQAAMIHWVDAQWSFPPPAIGPAGARHAFTTTVMRQSDQSPCQGWLVRYEIVDGPPAAFAPDSSSAIEVPTNAAGQACVEIFQQQAAAGTNRINIQVIRPGNFNGGRGGPLVIGNGSTLKTWSAAALTVRKTGPAVAAVGATITYTIDVSNPGDLAADDVRVVEAIPGGLAFVSSNPPGELAGNSLRWQLGRLGPMENRRLEVNYRAEREGSVSSCTEVTGGGGLRARDCATTAVSPPSASLPATSPPATAPPPSSPPSAATSGIDVRIVGPEQTEVGREAAFEVEITNRSQRPIGNLLIKDSFDPGLKHPAAERSIERDLGITLAPGQSQRIGVAFEVTRPGQHCHTVEIRDAATKQVLASARACVTGVSAGLPATKPSPQPKPQPTPRPRPEPGAGLIPPPSASPTRPALQPASVALRVSGPIALNVGETAMFNIEITNNGLQPVQNLRVVTRLDKKLVTSMATEYHDWDGDNLFWKIGSLASGKAIKYQLQARADLPAKEVCLQVTLRDERAVLAEDRACLEIRSAPATARPSLSLSVEDRHDPVAVGKELTYDIEVFNQGQQPDRDVVVVVSVPPEMVPVRLQTTGPTPYVIEGQTVRFSPVPQIDPGRSLTYRVRVLAKQSGVAFLRAQVSSQGLVQPIPGEQKTQVNSRGEERG